VLLFVGDSNKTEVGLSEDAELGAERSSLGTQADTVTEWDDTVHDDASLRQAVVEWIKRNRNKNTSKSYSSSFRLFVNWCNEQAPPLPFDPPTDAVVARYAQHLVLDKDAAFGTVSTRLAAIADDSRYRSNANASVPQPTRSVLVTQMMKCLKPMTKSSTKKLPLSMAHLHQMAAVIRQTEHANSFVLHRDFFMVVLACVTLLRRSEVVRLETTDIAVTTEMIGGSNQRVMSVFVNKLAKNDVERKGHTRYVLEASDANRDICPVRLYSEYISKWRSTKKWLFYQKANHAQLSSSTPNHGLKRLLSLIGLPQAEVDRYGFHSCRRGGATAAADKGIPIHLLKRHGNWRSDAVYEYIEDSLEQKTRVASAMLQDDFDVEADVTQDDSGVDLAEPVADSEAKRGAKLRKSLAAETLHSEPTTSDAVARGSESQVQTAVYLGTSANASVRAAPVLSAPISSLFRLPAPKDLGPVGRATGPAAHQKS
jgi:integrase